MNSPKRPTNNGVEILIAEDSLTQAEQLKHLLEERGYTVTVAANGKQALEAARASKPALIVSDIVMPEMDGYTLCKHLKSEEKLKDTPVIIVTSLSNPEDVIKGLECGADNFIRKPYDETSLLSRINYILSNRKLLGHPKTEMALEIQLGGKTHRITSERRQILDMLISTYEDAVRTNAELSEKQRELTRLAEGLERKVEERTAALRGEIAERRMAEEALHKTEEQLFQAQKMEAVGRLAGGIAHDFNNLLTVINGYSQLLLGHLDAGEPHHGHASEIIKAGERAAALTRQLLAFSRRQVLQPQVLELNTVVANVEKMLRRLIGEDIELKTNLASDLGRVKADAGQLEQVIMNLAVNARDAMPRGGFLTIETANVELGEDYAREHVGVTPGQYVMLAVSDSGVGMDKQTQARIFEPFFTTKEKDKGTGLGLATTYGIVKQSGGSIWVYSEPGRGTTFKIYLPRVEEAAQPGQREKVPMRSIQGTETILLVEDEEGVRSLVRGVLESSGYTVLLAAQAEKALMVAEGHAAPIHLLLTDVVMPGMTGRELAERLVFNHSEMKVLYMSGYSDNAVVHHGVLDPDTAFLQKPFTPHGLVQKVREVLDASPKRSNAD